MNYEYCTALQDRGNVIRELAIPVAPAAEERYVSMFGFDNSIYEHLEITSNPKTGRGTVSGFKGNYFCKFLYFDIDCENIEQSHERAKDFVLLLYNMLGINPKSLFIAFSGNKGFHIGLHQNLFGGFQPAKDIPQKINVLAVRLLMECFEVTLEELQAEVKENKDRTFRLFDLGIYNDNRIFRLLNSVNTKSGLYKIGLSYDQLNTLSMEQILEMAKQPQEYRFEVPPTQQKPMPELQGLWAYALTFDVDSYNKQQVRGNQEHSGGTGTFAAPVKGNRNNDLFRQAALLFDKSEFSEPQVLQLVSLINQAAEEPLPWHEVQTIVRSAFRKTLPNRQHKAQAQPDKSVEIFPDWLDTWAEYYTADPKPMSCIFPAIDRDQEENFAGKLACLIGQGGTRKSYFALNILAHNIMNNGLRVMYSSMEMGKVEMVNRLLDIVFPAEGGIPASKVYRKNLKADLSFLHSIKQAVRQIEDKLILSNATNKTATDYFKDYEKVQELYGPVDILCVDGLSMMGGSGTENERFERHTKELKALVNATGLFIPLICHTTKEAKPYMRDPAPYVRGSGKILDNCDFTIGFSNIINEHVSTPENIQYEMGFAHAKYYNKRGTGLTLNMLYDFNSLTKEITPSNREASHYPEYDAFVRQYNKKKRKEEKQTEANDW